ncbi:SDR family oxidoreductase [Altererythrobacter arenosus]|uniref:SDR family oxidoreductase n=1 Tax=Altererythrobacter arenosus TaxID=3032592 RepID=A0ABY8G0K1_9SPHN|nr:SDR family oxidoreductase [Altererythrobacter sp. CAU 1644]WFL77779.1 SDR family oxidoreductase [Altererythrobacter sp. CAU 1644]
MTIGLDGVVCVVTGANGGIGSAIAKAIKAAGAQVVGTDLGERGDHLECDHFLRHDVTDSAGWEAVRDLVSKEYGQLDALVNNAGISIVTKFEETPLEQFHAVNAVNVDSVILGTQALMPLLHEGAKARASGASIVNISSIGGLRGAAFNAAYCTSKAAVAMLTKCMGAEFAALGYGIRVNSVHPGGVDTGLLNSIFERYVELGFAPDAATAAAGSSQRHAMGRMGKPEEIAGGVVFLCSDAASFMTCDELVIDGGYVSV